jgi:hypothetical protein
MGVDLNLRNIIPKLMRYFDLEVLDGRVGVKEHAVHVSPTLYLASD